MSYGFGFGFPRLASLAAAGSPFATLGPTLDLNFVGTANNSGVPGDNDSLNLDFIGNTYQVGTQYSVWTSTGLQPGNFQDIVTFSRASTATFYNSSGYLTTTGILNYLTQSNTPENAAWSKTDSFVQTNLLTYSEQFDNAAWTKTLATVTPNDAIAPDGTQTADKVVFSGVTSEIFQSAGAGGTGSLAATGSVYIKGTAGETIQFYDGYTFKTPTVLTGNWQRLEVPVLGATRYVDISAGNGATARTIWLWGAQLVQGAVPGNYQATTTTALTIPYTSYDNTLTARWIGDNTVSGPHGIRQNFTGVAAQTYVVSFYAKAGTMNYAGAWAFGALGSTSGRIFDLVNGTTQSATGFIPTTYGMINAGNGWWRCWFTATSTGGTITAHIGPHNGGGTETYTGTGNGIYITDMQIEVGTSVGPYYETTTSQYNAPRFDYDPVTLQPLGLLVEEQRTNLLTYSERFDDVTWGKTTASVTVNTVLSPDGTVSADTITATSVGSNTGFISQPFTATASTTYAFSIYVKHGTESSVLLQQICTVGGVSSGCYASYNVVAGTTSAVSNYGSITGATAAITNVGNGWYRCSLIMPIPAGTITAGSVWFYPYTGADAAGTYAYAWGAQLEAGAFATSYIPTVASQVTRAVDSVFLNTLSPWFNQREGTLYVSASYYSAVPAAGTRGGFVGSGSYAAANAINIFNGGGTATVDAFFTSVTYPDVNLNRPIATAAYAINKIAYGYNQNNGSYNLSVNASAVATGTSTQNTATFTSIALGRRDSSTSNLLNGYIQRFSYYPRRLTNAELQSVTT